MNTNFKNDFKIVIEERIEFEIDFPNVNQFYRIEIIFNFSILSKLSLRQLDCGAGAML